MEQSRDNLALFAVHYYLSSGFVFVVFVANVLPSCVHELAADSGREVFHFLK